MSEHPPQHHNPAFAPVDPDPSGADPTLIDQVAGEPPVPITVWRTARTATDAHRSIGARLAYRLICAYSHPGEAVVDLTTDHASSAVCAAGAPLSSAKCVEAWMSGSVKEICTVPNELLSWGAWLRSGRVIFVGGAVAVGAKLPGCLL